ncbi:hypothetical protein CCS01_25930 [Rhodopila globiformis]|uniref:Uncharacterized protein n=2 Tax=Rhodopila globiformis TaxID=1071 RepID=A0A2S6MZQ7_RHOGL|nr:hypothetical protein CCS01_25930 [Rhodopila globiformis]
MNNRSFFHPFRVEMAGAQEISIALDADHHVHFTNEHRIVDFLGDLALKTENIPFIDHIIEQEQ